MGLRELEKKMKIKEAMQRKNAEYKLKEIENQAKIQKMTKARLKEIARKHGVLIALDESLKEEVEALKKDYNIKESNIIREILTEDDVLPGDVHNIIHEQLGMLAYQRVMLQKGETGGLLLLTDVFELVNTGILNGRITIDDVKKAVTILKKKKVIPQITMLDEDVMLISFFPVQYTQDQSEILNFAKNNKGTCSLAEVRAKLGWSEIRALRALENLENTGIAKTDESFRTGKRWFFPSLK
ncbi:MAG: hypothetical protein JW776_00135 [Candidatus Lokiarchaeota archaeon]|nr:hypothetical protein [Candidatus Lokiarchaeota archaeon]